MKHCPKCDFTFADFYNVCEFDGAELVEDPEHPPSSERASPPPSRFRRVLKSPLFLTGLLVVALLASALLIGYYDAANQSKLIAGDQPSQNSIVSPVLPTQTSVQIKTPATSSRVSALSNSKRTEKSSSTSRSTSRSNARRQATASPSSARLHSPASARNQPGRSPAALPRESQDTANKKEPKLTAMLKTTWHILKRPFKF